MSLEMLVNAALRMLLVGAVAWLVLRAFRTRNPQVEALIWRMTLLASLALPLLLYWGMAPRFDAFDLPTSALMIVAAGTPTADAAATAASVLPLPRLMLAIYLAVALMLIARLAAGLARMWRVSRAARPMAGDDVRISEHVRGPATFGSVILLPADAPEWDRARLDVVLTHERAHVRSRDGYWSWLAQLHAAIFWFSPLAWWLRKRLDALAETISDDAVVSARHDPVAYAALLLDFARHPDSRSVAMSVAKSNVSGRIERLLARTSPSVAPPKVARWAVFASLVPIVVLAASTPNAAPSQPARASAESDAPPPSARSGILRRAPNPDDYYPAVARHERVAGFAVVEVDLDALGQLVDARIVQVDPAEQRYGFADAALQVARNSQFGVLDQQPSTFRFKVKFSLDELHTGAWTPRPGAALQGRIVNAPNPDKYYPAVALQEQLPGSAVVEVDVDALGKLVNSRVVKVEPADPRLGFADAALRLAKDTEYGAPDRRPATFQYMVKFELSQ